MGQESVVELSPWEMRRAARVAARFGIVNVDAMRRRTERRIDYNEPAPRAVVVALTYASIGAFLPIPVAVAVPILRPATLILTVLGIVLLFFLRTAHQRLREHYAKHSSWRILERANRVTRQLKQLSQ